MCRCSAVGWPLGQTMSQTLMRSFSNSFVAFVRGNGGGSSCAIEVTVTTSIRQANTAFCIGSPRDLRVCREHTCSGHDVNSQQPFRSTLKDRSPTSSDVDVPAQLKI